MMATGASLITIGFTFANESQFHPAVTGMIRGLTAFSVSYCVSRWKQIDLTYPSSHNFKWHMIRQSIMTLQGFVYSWSLFYVSLPIAVTAYAATPIFVAVWDYIIYGQALNKYQKGWLFLAFLGVLLTANGEYLQ